MIKSMNEMRREFAKRAQQMRLDVDCAMDGAFMSELAVVSEAPGAREAETKLPLIGFSGKFLFGALRNAGYPRQSVYITNVIKRQLAFQAGKVNLQRHELDNWIGLLRWELSRLPNLKYVLVCGNYALQALTGEYGITKWRGSVLPFTIYDGDTQQYREYTAICTFNPIVPAERDPKTELPFRMDVARVKKVIDGTYESYDVHHRINPSFNEAVSWIDKMQDEKEPVSFDIETVSSQTACIGFANQAHEGMCINFRDANSNVYSPDEDKALYVRIQKLLADPDVRLVAQNGNFDSYWLWYKDRIRVRRVWFDTLLGHHTLYPQLPHNLGFLTSQYTTHPFYKDDKDEFREGGDIDSFWRYNVKDCAITWEVHRRIHNELVNQGLDKFFFSHVMRIQPHLVQMTVGGIKIDGALKETLTEELGADVAKLRTEFEDFASQLMHDSEYRPNPNSTPQMKDLFFNKLKLVGRGFQVDKANKERMIAHPRTGPQPKELLRMHTNYKGEQKFFSTYVDVDIDPDDYMRCEWKQYGVQNAPGRLSSSQVLWGSGTNLQNQPVRAYEMFVAELGYGFGYFDLSQAEARVVAWEANIPTWKEQFERARITGGYDCHRALASEMFGVPYDEVPINDRDADGSITIRFTAKRCRHGLNYRMNYPRLAETTGLPIGEAQHAYNTYHRITPELRVWWATVEREVRKTKALFNCYGRRLQIIERISDDSLESIVAFKPQSAIGDHVCQVIYRSQEDDRWPMQGKVMAARVALNIHDALIAIAPLSKIKTCLAVMREHAERPLMIQGEQLIIPADLKQSQPDERGIHRWSSLETMYL